MKTKISVLSRVLLIISSALLVVFMFVPIWQIQLDAPQYPEGLILKIYANKLEGNVDIINGLNHYIGMKTLHAKDFIEFTVLVYFIGFYALFALIAAIAGRKKVLYVLLILFVLFGVLAMVDFWRWEYNYGHDLNPNAAIIVPGMAYQPPLIGFKQLLNFGAYSIPDTGGWMFLGSGVLMLLATIFEMKLFRKSSAKKVEAMAMTGFLFFFMSSCGNTAAQPIKFNSDNCDHCKMTIADQRFACELVTAKGRVYKFDDVGCMMSFKNENKEKTMGAVFYVCDYIEPNILKPVGKLSFIKGESIGSPMHGNIAAFTNADSTEKYKINFTATISSWSEINQ